MTADLFAELLRDLASHDLLTQTHDGTIMLDLKASAWSTATTSTRPCDIHRYPNCSGATYPGHTAGLPPCSWATFSSSRAGAGGCWRFATRSRFRP